MHALTRSMLRRLGRQDAIALPVAMIVLLVIGTLSAMLLASSMESAHVSTQSRQQKAALAIANGGLQAAVYRLSQAAPTSTSSSMCFTTSWQAPTGGSPGDPASGTCPAQTEPYGTGIKAGTFTYSVTPTLIQSDGCTGLWVSRGTSGAVDQRCVTATGTVGGVTARVEERLVAYKPLSTFPVNGIFSLGTLTFNNTATVDGDIATNGKYAGGGTVTATNGTVTAVPPNTIPAKITCGTGCTKNPNGTAYTFPAPDPLPYTSTATSNNNAALCSQSGWPAGACDASGRIINASGSVGSAGSPVVFYSGVYNFCSVKFGNTTYLAVAPGAQVRILIDSPATGDGCPGGTGDLNFTNSVAWANPSHDASTLEIDAYGNPGGPLSPFNITNNLNTAGDPFYGRIYAPYSVVKFTNKSSFAGAIVAGTLTVTNVFTMTGDDGGSQQRDDGTYYPSNWHQCPPAYSGDPRNGCY